MCIYIYVYIYISYRQITIYPQTLPPVPSGQRSASRVGKPWHWRHRHVGVAPAAADPRVSRGPLGGADRQRCHAPSRLGWWGWGESMGCGSWSDRNSYIWIGLIDDMDSCLLSNGKQNLRNNCLLADVYPMKDPQRSNDCLRLGLPRQIYNYLFHSGGDTVASTGHAGH